MADRDWIELDAAQLNPRQWRVLGGVETETRCSPHDVPCALRWSHEPGSQRCLIELRYLCDEPVRQQPGARHLTLKVGRFSGRLCGILVDLESVNSEAAALQVKVETPTLLLEAVKDLARRDDSRRDHHLIVFEVLHRHQDLLIIDGGPPGGCQTASGDAQ